MAAPMENMGSQTGNCFIHYDGGPDDENVLSFTKLRWEKVIECAGQWMELECPEKQIAEKMHSRFDNMEQHEDQWQGHVYHNLCYKKFADIRRLGRTRKRSAKSGSSSIQEPSPEIDMATQTDEDEPKELSPKRLRSSLPNTLRSNAPVMPQICIICQQKERFVQVKHERIRDKLVQAETKSGGLLTKAATLKSDESILMHIRGGDCVALEVMYHLFCHREYTRFLTRPNCETSDSFGPYEEAYRKFCVDVVKERIITNQEILRMTKLCTIFNKKYAMKQDVEDLPEIRTDKLKRWMAHDFPQLVFFRPPHRNQSEMVYSEALSPSGLLEKIPDNDSTDSSTLDEETTGSEDEYDIPPPSPSPEPILLGIHQKLRALFNASLILKRALQDQPGMETPWPPTSEMLTCDAAKNVVPNELYNLLAWSIDASEEPTLGQLDVAEETHQKLLSICQDIMYLASSGKKQTPKALSLGLTVRHLTGSSQLLQLLHRLGHTASYKTKVGFETSLAQLQLLGGNDIPKGFSRGMPTVLVWDNIDFSEETPTGTGTTHHTNGIMVQKIRTLEERQRRELPKRQPLIPEGHALHVYHQGKKQGPQNINEGDYLDKVQYKESMREAELLDLIYAVMKFVDDHKIPGWRGFNMAITASNSTIDKSAIYYLPMIEASPTEMSTVNTILKASIERANTLGLQHIILVFDQAIYAKAQQIRWNDEDLTRRTIIRLGEFHTCMSYLSILGKRFMEAGLLDILIESQVIAPGSINGVSSGHHYNRSIRAHKLMYEALQRLRFEAFLESIQDQQVAERYLDMGLEMVSMYPTGRLLDYVHEGDWVPMLQAYKAFITESNSSNPTFAFWSSYIDMVQLLLTFIRATRESNWQLHLAAIRMMMAWFFAYDRVNYARYLPAYWLEMTNLPTSHPDCHASITASGEWTVQRQEKHSFSSIACDQAIEQTVNRDSKTKGGLRGITLNRAAVQRWILAHPEKSAIARQCELMAGINSEASSPKEFGQARIQRDEDSVGSIISTIENMVNPFQPGDDTIVCLSSGTIASSEVQHDLLLVEEKGEQALIEFMDERLIAKNTDLFAPLKSMRLKTFSNLQMTKKSTKSGKEFILQNDRALFARLLVIGQTRNIDLKEILTYSLGTVSFPLASVDGSLAKTTKSALLQQLEADAPNCLVDTVQAGSAIMLDGMAIIQSMNQIPATFGEFAYEVFLRIVNTAKKYNCTRVDFITDRYPDISIKNPERLRRAAEGSQTVEMYGLDQKTPKQWKKFLACGPNKVALVEFLCSCWQATNFESLGLNLDIYITHGPLCDVLSLRNDDCIYLPVTELTCDHEEADTRLLLHAFHAQQLNANIVIASPDTDVAVIAISSLAEFHSKLFFLTGVKNKVRLIDLGVMASNMSPLLRKALIGIHVFTGCDSVSAFYGKGKKKTYQVASASEEFLTAFADLGSNFCLNNSTFVALENFVCKLYGKDSSDVNSVRYDVFCTSKSELNMPPTKDALYLHCQRANYQSSIHKRCLQAFIQAPSPEGHGWSIVNNDLAVVWMTRDPAPEEVLLSINCGCKSSKCNSKRCSCRSSSLPCTDLCKCTDCDNCKQQQTEEQEEDSDDSESEN